MLLFDKRVPSSTENRFAAVETQMRYDKHRKALDEIRTRQKSEIRKQTSTKS